MLCICVWIGGEWPRVAVERCPDIGIELVGFPPGRARAIRDRLWVRGHRGLRFSAEPAIAAGRIPGLDQVLEVLARSMRPSEGDRRSVKGVG